MLHGLHTWLRRNRARLLPGSRSIALLALFFFGFQLSRFYVSSALDLKECLENHTHSEGLTSDHHHHSAPDVAPHPPDTGYSFQHCKDTLDGISLTPMQPFGSPIVASFWWLPESPSIALSEGAAVIQANLKPPFHPPRPLR